MLNFQSPAAFRNLRLHDISSSASENRGPDRRENGDSTFGGVRVLRKHQHIPYSFAARQKPLLEAKDFILPDLVGHTDNGDIGVLVAASTDAVQAAQILRLAECGEETAPSFCDLPYAEQQLERRRYFDYLKRLPKKEAARKLRQDELEVWRRGGDEAESNFLAWWERKQRRKQSALQRKANRLANCGFSGRHASGSTLLASPRGLLEDHRRGFPLASGGVAPSDWANRLRACILVLLQSSLPGTCDSMPFWLTSDNPLFDRLLLIADGFRASVFPPTALSRPRCDATG